jgi:hypothetical protein
MKRSLALFCALAFLLLSFAAIFPAAAATDNEWRRVTYCLAPLEEGGTQETGELYNESVIPRDCTIHFDGERATVLVDGVEVEPGHGLFWAGTYKLEIINKQNTAQKLEYTVTVMPNVNVAPGQVFTTYPTIVCTNVKEGDMCYTKDMTQKALRSGDTIRELGKFTLIFFVKDVSGFPKRMVSDFYVKAVHALHVVNEKETGLNTLDVIVGSFDDKEIKATLDGTRELQPGSNIVTEVGTHTLQVLVNGSELTLAQAMPTVNELSLRIELFFDELESKSPFYFDFTNWDADVYLDGKLVKGAVRVGQNGSHVLIAKNKDGELIENAFAVSLEEGEPTPQTEVHFTFRNPHLFYIIFVAAPALMLLGFAVYYLLARRRVV